MLLSSVLPLFPVCDWAAGWKWVCDCCWAKDAVWLPAWKLTQLQLTSSGQTLGPNDTLVFLSNPDFLWVTSGQRAFRITPSLLLDSFTYGIFSFHLSFKVIKSNEIAVALGNSLIL